MTVAEVAVQHYATTSAIQSAAVAAARAQWARLPTSYYELQQAYLDEIGPQILAVLILAQLAEAEESDSYVAAILAELIGQDDPQRQGVIDPDGFAYTAADGRDLDTLLYLPVARAQIALRQGAPPAEALKIGEDILSQIIATETRDASRTADGVAIAARPRVTGYVRMLTPPSCARCAVLAGQFYRWNDGFMRHPNCDCIHIPATEDDIDDARTDPRAAVLAGNVVGLSKAEDKAIRDGADVGQVVNSRRGMYTAGGRKFTTEGTTRRGFAAARFRQQTGRKIRQRLRPEQIYREANGNREEALRLLHLHGYIV